MKTRLRPATIEDLDLVYEWANDPVTRANSFSTDPIPYETHVKWFDKTLADSDIALLIEEDYECDKLSAPISVGQMRINIAGDRAELSYTIAPNCRRRGYGRQIIADTLRYMENNPVKFGGVRYIDALVKPENLASQEMLVHNGFSRIECESDYWTYVHPGPSFLLAFRVDMNPVIATGHLMRCLSIADAADAMGIETCFICADDCPVELLEQRGYKKDGKKAYYILNTDWQDMEGELTTLSKLINEKNIKKLIVDSYQVTADYLTGLKQLTEVTYLDDLNAFRYPVDRLIVYANYYKKWHLESVYGETATELVLGTDYVPLRREFKKLPSKNIKKEIEHILVMSGGSDNEHIIMRLLGGLSMWAAGRSIPSLQITAICGRYNEDYETLCDRYNGKPQGRYTIKVLSNVPNLIDYIQGNDLVITAGGTTLYEICACGTPAITYSFADNQLENVKQFEEDGLMDYAGDARDAVDSGNVRNVRNMRDDVDNNDLYIEDSFVQNILNLLTKYNDAEFRADKSRRMQLLVDGCGAERIVERMYELQ